MNGAVILNSIGLTLSLFVAGIFSAEPRRSKGGRYLALSCVQATLLFVKELADLLGEGRFDHLVTFLIYVNFLYGLPSIYCFLREAYGQPVARPWRHYAPALANLFCAAAFAWTGSSSIAIDGELSLSAGLPELLPFSYANLLAAAETTQLIVYAIAGLRFARDGGRSRGCPLLSHIFFAVLACYASYYAVRWTGVAIRLIGSSGGLIAPSPHWAGSAMIAIVAFFVAFLGFLLVANTELLRRSIDEPEKPRYGGKAMDVEESRKLVRRATELLSRAADLSDESANPRRLAEELGVPYYLLSRSVNERCGKSVSDLIRECRVERAKRLLDSQGDATILEIALEAGFSAKSSFYDAFRRVAGMSPSEYRRRDDEERAEDR